DTHAKEVCIVARTKPWWDTACLESFCRWASSRSDEDQASFTHAARAAKQVFFDKHIEEITTTNKCPWDLMAWMGKRVLPPCEAVSYWGRPCNTLPELWEGLHGSYN